MVTTESERFGTLLKRRRLAAGLTQEALAERAGVSAKAVSELERDPTRTPRLDTVALLATALRLDADGRARLLTAARPAQAPPETPAGVFNPGAMPRPLTPLFGRAGVAAAVAEIVGRGDARLLTLTGPGGVGKTRLAIAVAERVAGGFPDGVVFVDLAPLRDPNLVLPALARQLNLDDRDADPLPQRLAAALRRKRFLLLLDNFEHLLPAGETLARLLEACPTATALVTSRAPLRVRGEREYRVAPLEAPDEGVSPGMLERAPATALFLDRARAAGADLAFTATDTSAVAQICHRLDGLPLAIELAAAWARVLPPPALLARLDRRLPLLVDGPHDLPARQRTMRDTIAWSFELLAEEERRFFRRLCVFAGGFTVEAAEVVCGDGADANAVLTGLAALVDRSLLRARDGFAAGGGSPRLTMLETLREFGMERLEEGGEAEATRDAHAAHFAMLAETADAELRGAESGTWRHRLDADHDNLRGALEWSLARGDHATAIRLAGATWRFWDERGHLSEGRRWLGRVLELAAGPSGASDDARASVLLGAARLAKEQGAYEAAAAWSARAVAFAREREAPASLIAALNTQGHIARERGDFAEAVRRHEEALALAEASNDRAAAAAALSGIGNAAAFGGDIPRGIALCERSAAVFRALGDTRGLAGALIAVAAARQHAGDYVRSDAAAAEALALFRLLGDSGQTANALWSLGSSALFQNELDRAARAFEDLLTLRRDRGNALGAVEPMTALAMVALRQGDHLRARALLEETLVILDRYDDRWSLAIALMVLGHVDLATGDPARAADRLLTAAPMSRDIGDALSVPWCLEGLAGVAAALSAWELAARLCGARDALHEGLRLGLPPMYPAAYAQTAADCRAALSDGAFAAAYAVGQSLPPDAAIAEAAGLLAPHGPAMA